MWLAMSSRKKMIYPYESDRQLLKIYHVSIAKIVVELLTQFISLTKVEKNSKILCVNSVILDFWMY